MSAISGVKVQLFLVSENNIPLAGQRGATLNRSAETLDATSKDSLGWTESVAGLKSFSIDADGVLIESDKAYEILEDSYLNSEEITAYIQFPSGAKYVGKVIITDLPLEAPHDDLVTYSVSLQGSGALTKTDSEIV